MTGSDNSKSSLIDVGALTLTRVIGLLPRRVVIAIGAATGRLAGALLPAKRRRITENLTRAGVADPRAATRSACAHMGRTMAEMAWILSQSPATVDSILHVEGLEVLTEALAQGRGVLLAGTHLGNWELGAWAAARAGQPVHAIARRLGTPRVEAAIERFRESGGVHTLVRGDEGSSVAAYRVLRRGQVLACMMDRISAGRRVAVPMLKAHVNIPLGPLVLARRVGAPIVLGHVRRLPDWTTEVTLFALPGAPTDAPGETIEELATRVGRALDEVVSRAPEQWYWIHRRPAGRRSVAATARRTAPPPSPQPA